MKTPANVRDAYVERTAEIHAKLAQLRQLVDDYSGHDPDATHWGHVGDLGRVEAALDHLNARQFRRPWPSSPRPKRCFRAAARRDDGCVIRPDNRRGGARDKALTGLPRCGCMETGDGGNVMTDVGYAVAGRKWPAPPEDVQPVDDAEALHLLDRIPVRPAPSSPRCWWRCAARREQPTLIWCWPPPANRTRCAARSRFCCASSWA